MSIPTLVAAKSVRDRTDHETNVLNHVSEDCDAWVNSGRFGIISGQVKGAEKKMTEAIIITARVKQIDSDGFQAACLVRAMGKTVTGNPGEAASHAVAHLLNHLEPDEATSLAGGTDVTDRAMTRTKNAATVASAADHDRHLYNKVGKWEESHDRSIFSHGDQYLNRAQRETEVTRREGLTREQRAALAPLAGPSVLKTQTIVAAKSILGTA